MSVAFDNGKFELVSWTFDKNVVSWNETFTLRIRIKNKTGGAISSMYLCHYKEYPSDGQTAETERIFDYGSAGYVKKKISWANNAEKDFTITDSFSNGSSDVDLTSYAMNCALCFSIGAGSITDTLRMPSGLSYIRVVSAYDNFTLNFNANRYGGDRGNTIIFSLGLSVSGNTTTNDILSHSYSVSASYEDKTTSPGSINVIDVSGITVQMIINGITNNHAYISTEFDPDHDYILTLGMSNNYQTTSVSVLIPRAFANLHLSGHPTGGVAIGNYGSSELNNPKFECFFPMYLNDQKIGLYAGDVLSWGDREIGSVLIANGFITSSSKLVRLLFNLGQPIFAEDVRATGRIVLRGVKGYIETSDYTTGIDVEASAYTTTCHILDRRLGIVQVGIEKSTAFSNTTNNTPVSAATTSGSAGVDLFSLEFFD